MPLMGTLAAGSAQGFGSTFTQQTPKSIFTEGLVLHLDAGNPLSYPGTGSTWTDLTGQTGNGTAYNSPVWDSDNSGYFELNDTTNPYWEFTPNPNTMSFGTQNFGVELWFKMNAGGSNRCFFDTRGSGDGFFIRNGWQYGPTVLEFATGQDIYSLAYVNLVLDQWYQIFAVRTGTTMSIYANSVLVASGNCIDNFTSNSLILSSFFDGHLAPNVDLSIVRVYNNVSLTRRNVMQNFNFNRSRYGI